MTQNAAVVNGLMIPLGTALAGLVMASNLPQHTPETFSTYLNRLSWPDDRVMRFSQLQQCREEHGAGVVPNSPGRVQQLEAELNAVRKEHEEAQKLVFAAGSGRYGHLLPSWQEVARSTAEVMQGLEQQLEWERNQNVSPQIIPVGYSCSGGVVMVWSAEGEQRCSVVNVTHHYSDGRHDVVWDHCSWLESGEP